MAASVNDIRLSADQNPEFHRLGITSQSAKLASTLLQENHERNNIFFNLEGFHNHIAHQVLSLWALRATPADLQREFDLNNSYQLPIKPLRKNLLDELQDPATFMQNLGPEENYHEFLHYFKTEIEAKGWQDVLQKYLFSGDAVAESMLVRMFAGFLHPIIHLGFGVEFEQPAIIAEALAQAACHNDWIGNLLLPAESEARKHGGSQPSKPIVQILDEIRADPQIRDAPHWSDGNKIRDGLLARAADRMIAHAAQVHVAPAELAKKTAEMTNAVVYYTAGAQRRDKMVKYDFYFMHCVNSSIFFSAFGKLPWLSDANKARLLEWKIRMDVVMYASRKSPEILLDEIRGYPPRKPSDWDAIYDRACAIQDDGHLPKLIRAIGHGQNISQPYEGDDAFRLKHADWLQLAHMAIDSAEMAGTQSIWVRSAGFDEAWEDVPAKL